MQILRFDYGHSLARVVKRRAIGAAAVFALLGGVLAAQAAADPGDDGLTKFSELSRRAEHTTEAMHTAELDLSHKLSVQRAADQKQADDQATLAAAESQLATFRAAVNKFAVAMYVGGRTDAMHAILTAESPQQLVGTLAVQQVISTDMATQIAGYRAAEEQAAKATQTSAKSAADAKTAAEQAAAVRATLQSKQGELQAQIAVVKSQYQALTPGQQTALADPGPAPQPAAFVAAPAPEGVPAVGGAPAGGGGAPDGLSIPVPASERATVVQAALTQVGSPYAWGGAGPGGFDCSGLVMWAFQQAGISLPHSSQALAQGGQPVALSDLQPGDVLTFYSDASHAGIYIGDGLMVHSSTYGVPVRVVPMTSSGPIYDARRY